MITKCSTADINRSFWLQGMSANNSKGVQSEEFGWDSRNDTISSLNVSTEQNTPMLIGSWHSAENWQLPPLGGS